ncbi:MAG: glycosyltransferase family 39 protein [Pirellulaceae bacterium]|nr:glycosyltransferase family 39 protein [Pirellulaceae bacterium]
MPTLIKHLGILFSVCLLTLFLNLGKPYLWDRDEPRNAGCAAEMLARGDWVVPTFNDELRPHKPVLTYWFMMIGYVLFGVNEFGARFWSAVLGFATCLLTYFTGKKLFRPEVGLWSSIILATTLMFGVASHAATPDSYLIFFSSLAICLFAYWAVPGGRDNDIQSQEEASNRLSHFFSKWSLPAAIYGIMGVAVLAKGPVGFVLPTAILGLYSLFVWKALNREKILYLDKESRSKTISSVSLFLEVVFSVVVLEILPLASEYLGLSERVLLLIGLVLIVGYFVGRYGRAWLLPIGELFSPRHFLVTCYKMRLFWAMIVCLGVALPWYLAVSYSTDHTWTYRFFLEHNLGRASQAMESHSGGILFYPATYFFGFYPWSLFAVPVLLDLIAQMRQRSSNYYGLLFLCCWVGVYLGAFSLAATKLPSYFTPSYPAIALLTGHYLYSLYYGKNLTASWWPKVSLLFQGVSAIGITTGLLILFNIHLPSISWLALLGVLPLLSAIAGWRFYSQGNSPAFLIQFGSFAILFSIGIFGVGAIEISAQRTEVKLLLQRAVGLRDNPELATYEVLEPSWVFYSGTTIVELQKEGAIKKDDDQIPFWKERPKYGVENYLKKHPETLVVTTEKKLEELKRLAPATFEVLGRTPYFLQKQELLLLGDPLRQKGRPDQ